MRHGVLFYEATGLIPADLTFRHGVLFYEATRHRTGARSVLGIRLIPIDTAA